MTRLAAICAGCLLAAAALFYLRDPAWLGSVESGFTRWERDGEGTAYRWTSGHASFFVASDHTSLTIPVRAAGFAGSPVVVSVAIDDRPADQLTLTDERWHDRAIRLTGATTRRHRRIDLRVNRTLPGNRGVQIGEIRAR
jgi:hypothetical protein